MYLGTKLVPRRVMAFGDMLSSLQNVQIPQPIAGITTYGTVAAPGGATSTLVTAAPSPSSTGSDPVMMQYRARLATILSSINKLVSQAAADMQNVIGPFGNVVYPIEPSRLSSFSSQIASLSSQYAVLARQIQTRQKALAKRTAQQLVARPSAPVAQLSGY